MGCGCNKSKNIGNTVSAASRRVTVYEVQVNGNTVNEFSSLPEARSHAVSVGGRVKVTSKVVTG